ncbi:hypothetical protein KY284_036389 [Solanum tuberosum]|nr:hypothetical protein KY284_036389 [Solanum tuberosum]
MELKGHFGHFTVTCLSFCCLNLIAFFHVKHCHTPPSPPLFSPLPLQFPLLFSEVTSSVLH